MFKSKKISAIISLITATAISAGMMLSVPAAYATENGVQDFETVETAVGTGWRAAGDAGIAPTLENDLGGNAGECLALKADNNIIKGTDSQVRYYISDNFDKTKDYTFKTKIYLEKSDDVSAYIVCLVGGEDNSGGTELSFNSNGSITGATVSGTTWSEGWHELRVSIDATDTWYAWLDSNIITYGSALKGNITAEDIEFVSLMTVYTDISHPVTSCIAVDDSEIFNGIVGLVWNVDNKTVPVGSAIYGTVEYADNVFGDTAKGASIKIATAGGALPVMNNVLPTVGAGEAVSYSFDVGIDKFSTAADTKLAPYFFQVAVNSGKGWLGTTYGVTISNTGVINFFGVNTGKTIDAGKWHNFKYVFVSNANNTTLGMSLYVDGEYICTTNAAIPGAVANAKYTINHVRFSHNATDSTLYIDNIKFEKDTEATKKLGGFNWNMNNKTIPAGVSVGSWYADDAFGDSTKDSSLAMPGGSSHVMQILNPIPNVGGGETVSYSFDIGFDNFSAAVNTNPAYFFQMAINGGKNFINGRAVGVSIDSTGNINFFGKGTGKIIDAGRWHNFKYVFASNADNTAFDVSLYVDGGHICTYNFAVPAATANARYELTFARFCNNSATSSMYIDNISFEKTTNFEAENISSFNWNMDDKAVPGAVTPPQGGWENSDNLYATDVFGDSSKASSLKIESATSSPMLNVANPLSQVIGESVLYSFDLGVDRFSASNNTNPTYFFQMQVNGGYINGRTVGMSIDSEGKINFFGKDTGKTIDAGKWHNFKYLLASNQDDTELYMSLCVDGEWVCGYDFAVPNANEYRGYKINLARFCNNSSESTLYVDNISLVKEVPGVAKNCITSESLLIDGKMIHGYKGMNASQLRSALTVADGAVVGAIRTVDGYIVADEDAVAEGMTVTVEEGTSMRSYTLANEDMFASTDGSLYIKTPKYSDDSISTYTLLLDNGDGTADIGNIVYAVAVYDADLALTDVKLFPITLTEDDEDETVLDISEMTVGEEDALVIMAWDSVSNMEPVMEKHTLKKNTLATDAAIAGVFMDHMVLQRDMPINIWGTSDDADGAKVEISFAGNTAVAVVEDGEWETTLPAVSANATAQTLTVKTLAGEDTISDILVGDVYFVGGQSNSTFQLGGTDTWETDRENATADDNIRIMFSQNGMNGNGYSVAARKDPFKDAVWQIAEDITEEEAGAANYGKTMINFSAIGYYFADTLRADGIDVPIGLISTGKTSASLDQLSPASICADSTDSKKGQAYNGLIAPVEKMTVKGMLWYQGESDSISDALVKSYEGKFAKLINYLRDTTGNKDMPVFMVQLSSHSMLTNDSTRSWNVPKFRAMQFDMMQSGTIKNLYMVPSLDKGWKSSDSADTDHLSIAHPKYKKPIGQRLAKVAENVLYNGENVLAPVPVSVEYADGYCTITFDKELAESTVVAGFELIKDGAAYTATAKASGNTVNVVFDDSALANTAVDGVRYAFYQAAAPSVASLTGINGLPVPTFAFDNGEQEISALDIAMISRGAVETAE